MEVTVKRGRHKSKHRIKRGTTISGLLEQMKIDRETVIVRINKRIVSEEEELRDGVEIEIIMAVSGGDRHRPTLLIEVFIQEKFKYS